jgi:malate/lactate dehydrogenase
MKIGVIGVGAVGSASLQALVMRGLACEIVAVDKNSRRAQGVVADLQYGATLSPAVTICAGDYTDLADAFGCQCESLPRCRAKDRGDRTPAVLHRRNAPCPR